MSLIILVLLHPNDPLTSSPVQSENVDSVVQKAGKVPLKIVKYQGFSFVFQFLSSLVALFFYLLVNVILSKVKLKI